jgi:hypothetical protein
MAGNFLNRVAGWGLAVFGGKPSGREGFEIPLSRQMIWNNRVEDVLLASNDWGGIETWQGGSHYTFNNVVINAQAFKNWTFKPGNPENVGSFGHAYYMDGSFKNYLFNNIGLGLNNELGTKNVNASAIQNIISFENWYFNNSFHKFAEATRQQAGDIGRRWYLGNVFSDVSKILFRHANPKDVAPDPNASHYTQGSDFTYNTIGYAQNVIWDLTGTLGTFEETGVVYDEVAEFSEALDKLNAQVTGVGVMAQEPPLVDPENMNWSPAPGSVALEQNVLVFVPWSLGRTVGEWQFALNRKDPSQVIDEHWFMTAQYAARQNYRETPRYPLQGQNISAENYTQGPLSNWTRTALTLNGEDQYLRIPAETLPANEAEAQAVAAEESRKGAEMTTTEIDFGEVEHPVSVQPGGEKYRVKLTLDKAYPNQQLGLHVHWLKNQGWGGFSNVTFPHQLDERNYVIEVPAKEHVGMASYNLLFYLSPDGSFANKTAQSAVNIKPSGGGKSAAQLTAGIPRNVNVTDTSFILEAHLKTSDADGLIAGKMADSTGYQLKLAGGNPVFTIATGSESTATVTADTTVNDGNWHYLLAELDRENSKLSLYLDGKQAETQDVSALQGSLANGGDFLVGGGPEQEPLAATFDFLRVSLSTLEASRTSIEELHAWQFDGPQYRDFAGNDRRAKNAAGALVE